MTDKSLGQARDEILALLEEQGPLTREAISSRLQTRISPDQVVGCLSYLTVQGEIERPEGKWYQVSGWL